MSSQIISADRDDLDKQHSRDLTEQYSKGLIYYFGLTAKNSKKN
jgi:hypothetical protein